MKIFKRTVENFICENCHTNVNGNGYTNHCPVCLYSKHVDINPGDRANICSGSMKPVIVSKKGNGYIILHRCLACGIEKNNKSTTGDSFEALLKIALQ